jgi:hypothetical protein
MIEQMIKAMAKAERENQSASAWAMQDDRFIQLLALVGAEPLVTSQVDISGEPKKVFGLPIVLDRSLPKDVVELRDQRGAIGRIEGLTSER